MNYYILKVKSIISKLKLSGAIIALISFVFIAFFSFTELYDTFELRLYDVRFRIKPSVDEWDKLVFLDIDDNSIVNIGKYPWPRKYYASALSVLKEVGAKQVTFDMEFPNPSPDQINGNVLNEIHIKIKKKIKISSEEMNNIIMNNDNIFSDGVRDFGKVIIPYHFQKDIAKNFDVNPEYLAELKKTGQYFADIASVPISENKRKEYNSFAIDEIVDIARPIPTLIKSAYLFGYTNSESDSDGIARKIQLVRYFDNRVYFEMGLIMLMDICNVKKEDVVINPGSITLKNAFNPLTFLKKDIIIPIDGKGRLHINWAGPGPYIKSFKHIPFYALLEYPAVKEEIHDFFRQRDSENKSKARVELKSELDGLYEQYAKFDNTDMKRKASNRISEISKKISEIEKGYASEISREIEKLEKEFNKTKNADLKVTLDQLQNYLTGINIVISVESLRDKICLAGLVAVGTQDFGATPTDNEYWMVGTYHNIVNTILNEAYIVKINKFVNILLIFIFALTVGIIINRLGAKISLIAIVAALVIINVINIVFFAFYNIWFDQLGANLAVFIPSAVIAGMKLLIEESQKRYIKSAFSRYLAPAVIEKIIESPKALELGGEEQNITIFFSDIAKFSTISEKLTPPQLVALLNEYLSEMTNIILSYGGTVDKYIGDAIMAFYGAPLPYEDHARRCCMAAIDMKKRLRELQDNWRERKMDILKVRMGMNTGKAVVGNMGSDTQMGYTAMGDAVNLASRLEGVNKVYSTYAMISSSTYEQVKEDVDVRKLDTIQVVGKEEPIEIYELLGEKGKLPEKIYDMLEKYYKALEFFRNRDWKSAIYYFKQGLNIVNDDGPSLTYIDRCEKYIRRPPSKSWDGVNKMTSK